MAGAVAAPLVNEAAVGPKSCGTAIPKWWGESGVGPGVNGSVCYVSAAYKSLKVDGDDVVRVCSVY